MDALKRQALLNAARVVTKLEKGDTITRDDLIEELRQPLPSGSGYPSDAEILHAYRLYVINAGVQNIYQIVTYEEAAALANKSVEAIRQAAYRRTLMKSTEYLNGKERTGVFLKSLSNWCKWTPAEYHETDGRLREIREASDLQDPTHQSALTTRRAIGGNMTMFDGYVAVDWSASAKPVVGANSIWIAVCDDRGPLELENPATRQEAMNRIETLLSTATKEKRRLLCGFDFSFGYPEGTARMLTGRDGWEAVWARIAEVIEDCPNNRNMNNRFHAAAELNQCFEGEGPFWGRPAMRGIPGLLGTRPQHGWGVNLPPRLRYAEHLVPNAQEVWKIFYPGSVGGQALTGIAALEGLRHRNDVNVQIWPFETLGEGGSHVLAEIYPSLIKPCPGNEVLDARQVKAVAEALQELDRLGELEQHLRAPREMPACVINEEGLILGMQDPEGFRAAAQATPCR